MQLDRLVGPANAQKRHRRFLSAFLISDIEMPVLDGFNLLERIRELKDTLPVVMLTTRGSAEDRRRAASLGANAYLIKSDFASGLLLDTVGRFVDVSP